VGPTKGVAEEDSVLVRVVGLAALVAAGLLVAYDLNSGPSFSDGPLPSVRAALSCDGRVYATRQAADNDPVPWQETPESALQSGLLLDEQWSVDPAALRVSNRKQGRVLFVYDVSGRARFAAVVEGGRGRRADDWRLSAWAMCNPAELVGEDGSDHLGYGAWLDAAGAPVPTSSVMTLKGAEACGWEEVTFIEVDRNSTRPRQFVRDPSGGLADRLEATYAARALLPSDASDSGWRRNGYALWLQPRGKAAYLVNIADPTDVQRWPLTKRFIACA
jgi:hypothetical protein